MPKSEIQRPGECPSCKNDLVYRHDKDDFDNDTVVFHWSCSGCGKTGKEIHSMVFFQHEID